MNVLLSVNPAELCKESFRVLKPHISTNNPKRLADGHTYTKAGHVLIDQILSQSHQLNYVRAPECDTMASRNTHFPA